MNLEILKPFGPSIIKAKIPSEILLGLNKYVDDLVKDSQESEKLDYGQNLAGDVTQEFLLDPQFIKQVGWLDFLGKCTFAWIKKELNHEIKKFNVTSYKNYNRDGCWCSVWIPNEHI